MQKILLAAFVAVIVACGTAVPADAAHRTDLPLQKVSDLVVDTAHGRVFVSGGRYSHGILVTDLDGRPTGTVPGLEAVTGMVMAPDGVHLYAAATLGSEIAVVDTRDLSVRRLSTGAGSCPRSVAPASGLLWFVDKCNEGAGSLRAVDPVAGTLSGPFATLSTHALLLSRPQQRPGELLLGEQEVNPGMVHVLKVTGGSSPTVTQTAFSRAGGPLRSLTYTADASRIIYAGTGESQHLVLDADDLSEVATYDTSATPDAAAVRDDGLVAAGVEAVAGPDVYLFDRDGSSRAYEVGIAPDRALIEDGLAFGDQRLYAVTHNDSGFGDDDPRLEVIDPAASNEVTLVTDRAEYYAGNPARLTVQVNPVEAGRTVRVRATVGGQTSDVATGTTDASGAFRVSTTMQKATTFTADLLDDEGQPTGARDQQSVTVAAYVLTSMTHGYGHKEGATLYHAGKHAMTSTTFAPRRTGVCVRLRIQHLTSKGWHTERLSDCLPVDSTGHVVRTINRFSYAGSKVRVRAEWAGDSLNSASIGSWADATFTR